MTGPLGIAIVALFNYESGQATGPGLDLATFLKSPVFNASSSDAPIPAVYGFAHIDNPIIVYRDTATPPPPNIIGTFQIFMAPNIYVVAVACEGEIEAFDATYLDGVDTRDVRFGGGIVTVEYHTGNDAQPASALLLANFPAKWTANDNGAGIAYAVLKLTNNTIAFPGREPKITFDVRGKKVFDPRDSGTRFSPNPALCIRDFATNARYGRGIAAAKIDDTKVSAEATFFENRVSVPSIVVAFTADPATDQLTLASAAPMQFANQVMLSTTGALPAGLAAATVYYWIPVSPTIGKLATTAANAQAGTAIDITTAGTGVHTLTSIFAAATVYMQDSIVTGNLITFSQDLPLDNGDGVQVSSTGVLPQGLSAGVTYYWIRAVTTSAPSTAAGALSARAGRLASSYANALAGVSIALGPGGNTGIMTITHVDQPRYTCNGALDPSANPFQNFADLCSSCRSWFFEAGGMYHLIAQKVAAPSFDLTVDNILGQWLFDLGDPAAHFNRVEASFRNVAMGFQPDIVSSDSATERASDNGKLFTGAIKLPLTTNFYAAQRLAQLERSASRVSMKVACNVHIQGFEAFCGDVVRITHPTPGWINKLFRLARIDLASTDEYRIELSEYADSVYTTGVQAATLMPVRTNLVSMQTQVPVAPPNVSGLEIFTP